MGDTCKLREHSGVRASTPVVSQHNEVPQLITRALNQQAKTVSNRRLRLRADIEKPAAKRAGSTDRQVCLCSEENLLRRRPFRGDFLDDVVGVNRRRFGKVNHAAIVSSSAMVARFGLVLRCLALSARRCYDDVDLVPAGGAGAQALSADGGVDNARGENGRQRPDLGGAPGDSGPLSGVEATDGCLAGRTAATVGASRGGHWRPVAGPKPGGRYASKCCNLRQEAIRPAGPDKETGNRALVDAQFLRKGRLADLGRGQRQEDATADGLTAGNLGGRNGPGHAATVSAMPACMAP